jgi:hypothetical protein
MDRKDRSQGLQIGEVAMLDHDFNNASEVKILHLSKLFAIVEADGVQWRVMKYRLTKKIDLLTDKIKDL